MGKRQVRRADDFIAIFVERRDYAEHLRMGPQGSGCLQFTRDGTQYLQQLAAENAECELCTGLSHALQVSGFVTHHDRTCCILPGQTGVHNSL